MNRLIPAFALLLLAGCARDETTYPSLAPRAVEKLGFAEPEAPPPAAVAPDPALDRTIAAKESALAAIVRGFDGDAARAERMAAAAKGRAVGSDAWLEAQTALAALDDWRAQATALVTDLDTLAADRAATLAPDYPALAGLRTRAQAEAARQSAAIARLTASLPAA